MYKRCKIGGTPQLIKYPMFSHETPLGKVDIPYAGNLHAALEGTMEILVETSEVNTSLAAVGLVRAGKKRRKEGGRRGS